MRFHLLDYELHQKFAGKTKISAMGEGWRVEDGSTKDCNLGTPALSLGQSNSDSEKISGMAT